MRIRHLRPSDIRAASKIVELNYSKRDARWTAREMKEMFGKGVIRPRYLVFEDKGRIIGFAGYIESWMDEDVYHIFWVSVSPERQREGIGTAMVKQVIAKVKKKKAAMLLLTTRKPKFYSSRFKFKSLYTFKNGARSLMSLKLKN